MVSNTLKGALDTTWLELWAGMDCYNDLPLFLYEHCLEINRSQRLITDHFHYSVDPECVMEPGLFLLPPGIGRTVHYRYSGNGYRVYDVPLSASTKMGIPVHSSVFPLAVSGNFPECIYSYQELVSLH